METSLQNQEEKGWPTAGYGFVKCECCKGIAREEECVCFLDYLHELQHGVSDQPSDEISIEI